MTTQQVTKAAKASEFGFKASISVSRALTWTTLLLTLLACQEALADVKIISWNAKHIGRQRQDLKAVVSLLKGADIVAIQEVNTGDSGAKAVAELARILGASSGVKYCVGLSEIPTDSKERYAMLWVEGKVSYITTDGNEIATCPVYAVTLRLGAKNAEKIIREPAVGTFKEKDGGKFTLATIHLVPTAKRPEHEVAPLFDTVATLPGKWPKIVLGDFNLDAGHPSFDAARSLGFRPALSPGVKTSLKTKERAFSKAYDNIWATGVEFRDSGVINPYKSFPDMSAHEIFNLVSDHAPIWAGFKFGNE